MTTPSKAQIEAAKSAYWDAARRTGDSYTSWEAAITAAAQVRKQITQEDIDGAKAIIEKVDQTVNRLNFLATIERCAQVAEQGCSCPGKYLANAKSGGCLIQGCPQKIAAAIRKLKDE